MELFKKETLTHGLAGGAEGVLIGTGVAALGVTFVPAVTAAAVAGTVLGALHGAGDEGGECRKVVDGVKKAARWGVYGAKVFTTLGGGSVIEIIKNATKEFSSNAAS